jgi:hypothetical protein
MTRYGCLLALLFLFGAMAPVQAQWGNLEGQFIIDGDIPEIDPIIAQGDATVKDAAVCAAQDIPDDSRMFDAETGGVMHVFIYLRQAPDEIHPDLATSVEDEVMFDQKGCRFTPHSLIVRTDQAVRLISSDAVAHNVHTYPFRNQGFNSILQPNDQTGIALQMPQAESLPVKVGCDIHPHMAAYWVVVDHPYAAISDAEGRFSIPNLPAGTHEFRVWHEKVGYVERSLEVEITDGETTTLEPIGIPISKFFEN